LIGHASPEAAAGGNIALVCDDASIRIDIPNRSINVDLSVEELADRRIAMEANGKDAWKPKPLRQRQVTAALKAYALLATSADRDAVRNLEMLE
jgi:dihydroxy-acid dehydratase